MTPTKAKILTPESYMGDLSLPLYETGGGFAQRDPRSKIQARRDLELIRAGVMDRVSYHKARKVAKRGQNPVRLITTSKHGELTKVSYSFNVRTIAGNDWMAYLLTGSGIGSFNGNALHASFTASSVSGNTVVSTLTPGDTVKYLGHTLTVGLTYGSITAHGSGANAVFTVDRWYDTTVTTGAAGTTPTGTPTCVITPGQFPGFWLALDATSRAVDISHTTLSSELTNAGVARANGRASLGYSHPGTITGTATQAGAITLQVNFTYTAGSPTNVTFYNSGIFNAVSGGIMIYEAVLSPGSTLLNTSDQAQVTWTENF